MVATFIDDCDLEIIMYAGCSTSIGNVLSLCSEKSQAVFCRKNCHHSRKLNNV